MAVASAMGDEPVALDTSPSASPTSHSALSNSMAPASNVTSGAASGLGDGAWIGVFALFSPFVVVILMYWMYALTRDAWRTVEPLAFAPAASPLMSHAAAAPQPPADAAAAPPQPHAAAAVVKDSAQGSFPPTPPRVRRRAWVQEDSDCEERFAVATPERNREGSQPCRRDFSEAEAAGSHAPSGAPMAAAADRVDDPSLELHAVVACHSAFPLACLPPPSSVAAIHLADASVEVDALAGHHAWTRELGKEPAAAAFGTTTVSPEGSDRSVPTGPSWSQ